jgi:hypothetical protein
MTQEQQDAQAKANALHDAEEREKALAASLPPGAEKDAHVMKGDRMSDEAWAIEEANDIDFRSTGLWKDTK